MLITFNIGNTTISIGVFNEDDLLFHAKIKTDKSKTADEYSVLLNDILKLYNIDKTEIKGSVLSSVVPKINDAFESAIKRITNTSPVIIGPGVKTGLNIMIDNPSQLGSDIVAAAVGASNLYKAPVITLDFGTATTITVIDKGSILRGVSIFPGAGISLEALIKKTTMLPEVSIEPPKDIIGTNSSESMKSGIIYGTASMADGMIERLEARIGCECNIIATGGLAKAILPYCKHKIIHNPNLILQGLYQIYKRNAPKPVI